MAKVDIARTKPEILKLQQEAVDSESPESTIVVNTIEWLLNGNADSPLTDISEEEEEEEEEIVFDEEDDDDDEEIDDELFEDEDEDEDEEVLTNK